MPSGEETTGGARPSLRTVMVASVVLPLVLAVVGVGLLAWASGRRTAADLALRVQEEVGDRIEAELRRWLDVPHALNQANVDLLRVGLLPIGDRVTLRQHLFRQLGQAPAVSYVQLGWEADGGFVGVERNLDGTWNVELTDEPRTGKDVFRLLPDGATLAAHLSRVEGYDARTRPWYRAAADAGKPAWSPIYQFSSRQAVRLGITAVQPIVDVDGHTIGVAGADLVLSRLSDLLEAAAPGGGGRVAVVERDGRLVAASGVDPFVVGADGEAIRLAAADAPDPLIRSAVAGVLASTGTFAALREPLDLQLRPPDGAFVHAAPLTDGRGLDWVVLVATPAGAVTATVDADARRTALLGLVVLVIAAVGGGLVSGLIARPVLALSQAARALARGNREHPLPTPGTRELAALASAFETMRVRMAATLDEAERARFDAETANRAKSAFLASMSHELRTPLNAVVGYTDLMLEVLEDGPAEPEELRGDLGKVRASAVHLLGLINELLDLARIESGRLELHPERVNVGGLLMQVADTVRPLVEHGRNELDVDFTADLGWVRADPARLRQVLLNLLGNAAKFTDGGVVMLHARRIEDGVEIRVVDTGMGIPEQRLATIFEPFTRLASAEGREGAGLGLAIVKRLVDAMGGKIAVQSRVGAGTAFTLTLPHDTAGG